MVTLLLFFSTFSIPLCFVSSNRTFSIDYEQNCFAKDNQCFQYIAGSIDYYRVPYQYWDDRILKMKAAGLDAVQTYIPWNYHEPQPQQYNFSGQRNLTRFFDIVHKHEMLLILRPGPFVDNEIDMGGLPWWLLKDTPDVVLRTSDQKFLGPAERWLRVLLPKIKPYLYSNGGPVITVQIENEYGSYFACDRNYTVFLRNLSQEILGNETVLFTTDGNNEGYLKCGVIPGVYPTIDFGVLDRREVKRSFAAQRKFAHQGPYVNSEFYPGWFDLWGGNHSTSQRRTRDVINTMTSMKKIKASFTIYMFHGGTNFGYLAGAEGNQTYFTPVTTSYDFDAPLNEAGDPTCKYNAIRKFIQKFHPKYLPPVPPATKKSDYGSLEMKFLGSIIDLLDDLSPGGYIVSDYPLSMEQLDQPHGYILYVTKLKFGGKTLKVSGIRDRGYVIYNGRKVIGTLQRPKETTVEYEFTENDILHILVENQGRICVGPLVNDSKGIVSNVTLDGTIIKDWIMNPIKMENLLSEGKIDDILKRKYSLKDAEGYLPSVYVGTLRITGSIEDTFFYPDDWGKGQVFVNQHNLGRYWPSLGPQITLFVPKFYLNTTTTVLQLELEKPGNCKRNKLLCGIKFIDHSIIKNRWKSTGCD